MKKTDQTLFQDEIRRFFSTRFPVFKLYEPSKAGVNFAYYLKYPDCNLSIVVELPLCKDKDGKIRMTDRRIGLMLKPTGTDKGPGFIELVDTMIDRTWPKRLQDRLDCLRELIAEIRLCPDCSHYPKPQLCRTRDSKHTLFVALRCPFCQRYAPTTYGIGLKTRLHRDLKRRHHTAPLTRGKKEKETESSVQVSFLLTRTNGFKERLGKILTAPPGYTKMNAEAWHAFAAETLKKEELEKNGAGPEGEEPDIEIIRIEPV